ncbi:arsenic resistance protein [Gudongella sp. DL1XJH-153]|uniref:arsenic resistance protein n=1 Tax=Gudongella sp. DL1XJH-153 TaxID=3409804 RepID=UPI003BB7BB61
MFKILAHIKKKLVIYLPVTMILAIIFGYFMDPTPFKALVPAVVFFMVYPMMITLRYSELFSKGNTKLHLVAQGINFVIFPLMGFLIGRIFFPGNTHIMMGLLLMALLPTSGMTISWTGFAKGNVSAAIKMMVVGLILGSVLMPFYLNVFMGETAGIPFMKIINEIVKVVFIPMALGFTTQKILLKKFGKDRFQNEFKTKIPLIATAALIGIVFISTAMRAKVIVADPAMLVKIFLVLSASYAVAFLVVTIIARSMFEREDGIALIYGTVMRNLSIALAIALSIFSTSGPEVALIVAVGFVVQIQGAALYLKLVDKVYIPNLSIPLLESN